MQQNTKEWLEFRRSKIGGSDAPIIMGVSPWTTPHQLYIEKILWTTEERSNHAMERGKNLEEKARNAYEKVKGTSFFPKVVISEEFPWMIASMDGLSANGYMGVEIKCPGPEAHQIAVNGKVPDYYYPQLQHQIYVCNLPKIDYWSFDGHDGVIVEVAKDIQYLKTLLNKELEFYEFMRTSTPPPLSDRDFVIRDDNAWSEATAVWRNAKKDFDAASECLDAARQTLISMAVENNTSGCGIKMVKSLRAGAIEYSNIPELKNVNLDQYRKKSIVSYTIRDS